MLRPESSLLRHFIPLNDWSNNKLVMLASHLEIKHSKAGDTLIERGSREEVSYYLISGKVKLTASDGKVRHIDADGGPVATPLSQLLPRQYDVLCITPVQYIAINNSLISDPTADRPNSISLEGYEVSEEEIDDDRLLPDTNSITNQLTRQLEEDLKHDRLSIPSLPEIASKVGRAIEEESSDANTIARIIQTDPAITAKIVKAANSAFYGSQNPVDTCPQAVVRLGMSVTHSLVVNYTLRDLFKTKSKQLNQRMHKLWLHSIKVASLCYVLSKHCKVLNPDEAMAIGLLHDIGIAAIINQAENYPDLISDPVALDGAIDQLRGPFGSRILKSWRFPEQYIIAAEEAEDWMRGSDETENWMGGIDKEPDYCDILIIAKLHSYVGSKKSLTAPALDKVPAIHHIAFGPSESVAILQGANEEIEKTKSLLIQ